MCFSYYGSKSKIIKKYPPPKYSTIIEPFCGAAWYSLEYFDRQIILNDLDENIFNAWKFLLNSSIKDIVNLPDLKYGLDIRNLYLSNEEISLLKYCTASGSTGRNVVTKWGEKSWNSRKRQMIKFHPKIRHWQITNKSFEDLPNITATWFIDPPYQFGGEHYKKSNKNIDFDKLLDYVNNRNGHVIVCENDKQTWLPSSNLIGKCVGQKFITNEIIYQTGNEQINDFF